MGGGEKKVRNHSEHLLICLSNSCFVQLAALGSSLPTLESSANGLSGSESLPQCEKEVGEPTSEAGGVGSSFFTSAGGSTSMETRSFSDSEEEEDNEVDEEEEVEERGEEVVQLEAVQKKEIK